MHLPHGPIALLLCVGHMVPEDPMGTTVGIIPLFFVYKDNCFPMKNHGSGTETSYNKSSG